MRFSIIFTQLMVQINAATVGFDFSYLCYLFNQVEAASNKCTKRAETKDLICLLVTKSMQYASFAALAAILLHYINYKYY